jgi:hypothetical protein
MPRASLQQAIDLVRQHFTNQCGGTSLTHWSVLEASEDLAKGAYVIRCEEHCFLEPTRTHEVWVDPKTGEIAHQHRIDAGKPGSRP